MIIKNKTLYDVLKWIARYCLGALAVLYGALADVWNLPMKTEIIMTLSALSVFINTLLGISNENYNRDGNSNNNNNNK